MTKKNIVLILFLLVLIGGIGTVSAETLTGTLGETGINQTFETVSGISIGSPEPFTSLYFKNFENTQGFLSLISFTGALYTFDTGAPAGVSIPLTVRMANSSNNATGYPLKQDGRIIGTGSIGYQRYFNLAGTEQPGAYVYVILDDWDLATDTGIQYCYLEYDHHALYNASYHLGNTGAGDPNAIFFRANNYKLDGNYIVNRRTDVLADYTATKPGGIGINGTINKTHEGTVYNSRGYILSSTGSVITSESASSSNDFNFTVTNETIKVAIYAPSGIWYNSSTLFSAGTGYPTPTPTPTPSTTVAPGYVRTTLHVWDRSGAMVHGANIYLKDVSGGIWSNVSSDADGIHYIDTLPTSTIDMYSEFTVFENELLPGSLLSQEPGYTYFLTLYPYESSATEGNVSLYVEVKDTMGSFIPYANVQIFLPSGYSYSGSTANAGSKVFLVPNDTVIRATGTASGYLPATIYGNSGSGGSTTMTITLSRQVVTVSPTTTIPPGGITPAVTVDPRSVDEKDEDMMNQIRDAGPNLISLAILVTTISLLGLMTKGFK